MAKNNKSMNEVFGRRAVVAAAPDNFWPLASELVGVEIEVEEMRGRVETVWPEWTTHPDQSLRNGIEFVTSGPLGGAALTEAINKFFNSGITYNMSPRTSVHVHVNASDNMTVDQFRNLFTIMYLIEPAVFRWADENRKWCGYCSPLTDLSPWRIISILNENKNDGQFAAAIKGGNNQDRYYGLNVASYGKHGTVEFRYFPCTDNKDTLISWIKFAMYVKKASREYGDPGDLLGRLVTRDDLNQFIADKFGEVAHHINNNLDFDDCLGRVKDLRGMLGVTPEQVKAGEGYKTHRSKGLTKLLARSFPASVPQDTDSSVEAARRESDDARKAYTEIISSRARASDMMAAYDRYLKAEMGRRAAEAATVKKVVPKKPAPARKKSAFSAYYDPNF